jgi:hypothetical protein
VAARPRPPIAPHQLQGLKYFANVSTLLARLRPIATERDRAGNRDLFCDQYIGLLLIYFFNSIVTSLRALQQVSELEKVQGLLGVGRVSLGSLSEAARVFDARVLHEILAELALKAVPLTQGREAESLRGLTAVDGSILPALSRMAWALWKDDEHRGVKLHLHFDVLAATPADAAVTPAACSEPAQLAAMLKPGRLYVVDRGYASFELGTSHHKDYLRRPVRLVIVERAKPNGAVEELWLVTDRLDLDADLVALAYKYRWTVELFFRWFKCILGCRHLLSTCRNGVTIQVYVALMASLLITLWTGRKANKRTFEMIQFYLLGWASEAELQRHLDKLANAKTSH